MSELVSYLYEDDVCAGFSEGNGDRCANASCCAGDESSLPFEGEESLCSCHCDECVDNVNQVVRCEARSRCFFTLPPGSDLSK